MDLVEVLQGATCRVNPPPSGTLLTQGKHQGLSKRNLKCDSKQEQVWGEELGRMGSGGAAIFAVLASQPPPPFGSGGD